MGVQDELALALSESELHARRKYLWALTRDLAERAAWLDDHLPEETPTVLPHAEVSDALMQERQSVQEAHTALLARRAALVHAEEAALSRWQQQLEAASHAIALRERAHKEPIITSRTALNRTTEAPELSLEPRKPSRVATDDWRVTLNMPQAKIVDATPSLQRSETLSMTPEEHAEADRNVPTRTAKRRTGRLETMAITRTLPQAAVQPEPDPRDLVPLATPHDLPTIAPAAALPPSQHRRRAVTEPFVAALDMDGVYLSRNAVTIDPQRKEVRLQLDVAAKRPADGLTWPQNMTYRSREGDVQVFALREVTARPVGAGERLVLQVAHWKTEELQAFQRALDALP